ncbi:MAG: cupredoxin domain-containing protein [Gallionellaceae bacterium]|nr:cupredoxin domain-containing protein [Gallionellaceae bacterium]MDD5365710.1 cupredoxin domain-containing protein [Gallionellaceae bacterium]
MKYLALFLLLLPMPILAADVDVTLVIKNNRFSPAEPHVPAGKKIRLVLDNQDAGAEEFESYELNREKVIAANSRGYIFIGPLTPGRYPFFGDFHQQTARGVVIVE